MEINMEKECIHGLMECLMMENMKMIEEMGKEFINGLTDLSMMGIGSMENKMAMGY